MNAAGLLRSLTPNSETTDMMPVEDTVLEILRQFVVCKSRKNLILTMRDMAESECG